jgi:hypothetical protein
MRVRIRTLVRLLSFKSQKVYFFYMKNIFTLQVGNRLKTCLRRYKTLFDTQGFLLILVNFHAPGYGSAFLIRIRILDSQINADPQHWLSTKIFDTLWSFSGSRSDAREVHVALLSVPGALWVGKFISSMHTAGRLHKWRFGPVAGSGFHVND